MPMPKRLFFIACEPSGDIHGAELIKALKEQDPSLVFRGLGGPRMAGAGMELLTDMTRISALGLSDVIRNYFTYRKIFYAALDETARWDPEAVIMIDSPAFNLRFAKQLKKRKSKAAPIYYICPQIWAWGRQRISVVKQNIAKMFSILPFESRFYRENGIPCDYVGNPLLDHMHFTKNRESFRRDIGLSPDVLAIGLLPGSRASEVERILPVMLESAKLLHRELPQTKFFLARSGNVPDKFYDELLASYQLPLVPFQENFYDYVRAMDFALVTSGTATLQTALAGTPFFLLYKASLMTYFLGKYLIQVPYLGIVNLLAEKKIVPEFIQGDAHPETICHEAKILLTEPKLRKEMQKEFEAIRKLLGENGASQKTAKLILDFLAQEEAAKDTRA